MSNAEFESEVIRVIPQLRAYAMALTRSRCEADDLVQDALMRAWSYRAGFNADAKLKPWLFKILRTCLYTDSFKRRLTVQDIDGKIAETLVTPAEQEWRVEYSELLSALEGLNRDGREAVLLVLAAGLTYEEAAQVCSCPVGTMKSRVNRARLQLAQVLDPPTLRRRRRGAGESDRAGWRT